MWADALKARTYRRKMASVLSALRVASAFRTVSDDAVCVVAGMPPVDILAMEQRLFGRSSRENRRTERAQTIAEWQTRWNQSQKGHWTFRLIPSFKKWVNRRHGEVNFYLTQLLTSHGCFRGYLHKYKIEDTPSCPTCKSTTEDVEHMFFRCPRFLAERVELREVLGQHPTPENIVDCMLATVDS